MQKSSLYLINIALHNRTGISTNLSASIFQLHHYTQHSIRLTASAKLRRIHTSTVSNDATTTTSPTSQTSTGETNNDTNLRYENQSRLADRSKKRRSIIAQQMEGSNVRAWSAPISTRPLLLTLDAFDTIFTPTEPVQQQYAEVAAVCGIHVEPEDISKAFKEAFMRQLSEHPNYGKPLPNQPATAQTYQSPEEWWKDVITTTFKLACPEPLSREILDGLTQALYVRFSSSAGYSLFSDVIPLLELIGTTTNAARWPPSRTMLGVVSNSDPRVRDILASFNIRIWPSMFPPRAALARPEEVFTPGRGHFAFSTFSYDTGVSKPDPKIFDFALRDAQTALSKLIPAARLTRTALGLLDDIVQDFHHMHVGDELEKDVLPALAAGWDAVLIDRASETKIEERTTQDGKTYTVINSLAELSKLTRKDRLENRFDQRRAWKPRPKPRIEYEKLPMSRGLGRKLVPDPADPENRQILE